MKKNDDNNKKHVVILSILSIICIICIALLIIYQMKDNNKEDDTILAYTDLIKVDTLGNVELTIKAIDFMKQYIDRNSR